MAVGNMAKVKSVSATAFFKSLQSSVKKSILDGDATIRANLLAHEQLHMDLTDWCARKMEFEVKKLTANGTSPNDAKAKLAVAIKAKFAELMTECQGLHNHAFGEAQTEWDKQTKIRVATPF